MIAADSACYIAKERGRNRIHVYRATDRDQIRRSGEMRWMQRIKKALDTESFELYAQAIHPLKENLKGKYCYEILLRLNEEGRIYTPQSFLNAAERYDLMPDIDKWVIHSTLEYISHIRRTHPEADKLSFNVNLSGQSLNNEQFNEFVSDQFIAHRVDPRFVTFEITETAAIANLSRAIAFIREFKNRGCHFALDDFGSGLSSFGYLTSLPVDYIKIDGKIIRDVVTNPVHLSIVEAINQIAHVMQLKTIAEFVEDNAILEKLKAIHIDYAQGFAIATPQPMEEIYFKN
jgi:EAL domain-containing protein (putative c-di-GMP-specific phosphodiesterase class I)